MKDIKFAQDAGGSASQGEYYYATVEEVTDYYPFGMAMPGRTWSKGYRYGFQGQDGDDKMQEQGKSVIFKYRIHDPRAGRFFALDPLTTEYPWNSTYAFSENRVLDGGELEGLENKKIMTGSSTITIDFEERTDDIEKNLILGLKNELEEKITEIVEAQDQVPLDESTYLEIVQEIQFSGNEVLQGSGEDLFNGDDSYRAGQVILQTGKISSFKSRLVIGTTGGAYNIIGKDDDGNPVITETNVLSKIPDGVFGRALGSIGPYISRQPYEDVPSSIPDLAIGKRNIPALKIVISREFENRSIWIRIRLDELKIN